MDGRYEKCEALGMVNKEGEALRMNVMRKKEKFFLSERNNLSQYDKRGIMDYSFWQTRYWG